MRLYIYLFSLLIIFFIIIELLYIKLATAFSINDRPNERSSHVFLTIRGGGVIFPLAYFCMLPFEIYDGWQLFCLALLIIATVSFMDDIFGLDSKLRLFIQSIAVVGLLFSITTRASVPLFVGIVLFTIVLGLINAYNFMDGINGITVLYSLATVITLFWISTNIVFLQSPRFFLSVIAALLVFAFFNVRKKALCFAGDVGSISISFIICLWLFKLMLNSDTICWIFFLSVYGIDVVFTIFCRILRKERLIDAHRSHFYQFLANEKGWSHLQVSVLYAGVQAIINGITIYSYLGNCSWVILIVLFVILLIYTIFRLRFEGRYRLFAVYNLTTDQIK